jgi:hypothetical protein
MPKKSAANLRPLQKLCKSPAVSNPPRTPRCHGRTHRRRADRSLVVPRAADAGPHVRMSSPMSPIRSRTRRLRAACTDLETERADSAPMQRFRAACTPIQAAARGFRGRVQRFRLRCSDFRIRVRRFGPRYTNFGAVYSDFGLDAAISTCVYADPTPMLRFRVRRHGFRTACSDFACGRLVSVP